MKNIYIFVYNKLKIQIMRKYFLYVLIDPNVKIPKYIGISNNPERRFNEHLEDESYTPKVKWINKLKEGGQVPILKVVKDTNNVKQVCLWEKKAIEKYKETWGLVNSTKGGEYYGIGTPIDIFDMEGNYLSSYDSMIEYCELRGLSENCVSSISQVCLRHRNYAYGYIYRYSGDIVTEDDLKKLNKSLNYKSPRHFIIVSPEGELLGEFDSLQEAERRGFGKQNYLSEVLRNLPKRHSANGNIVCYSMEEFQDRLEEYLRSKSKGALQDCISKYDFNGNLLGTYYTLSSAYLSIGSETTGNLTLIKKCCEGEYKQAFGYQWKYGKEKSILPFEGKTKRKQNLPVAQYSKEGKFIKNWNCAREAADALYIDRAAINRAAKGLQKTTGGYIWKYVDAV